jgi:hypothetical protein
MQQVAVFADGFAWNGNTYPSLSKVAVPGRSTAVRWLNRTARHHVIADGP